LGELPRITPFLWFDNNAQQAVDFYLSIFSNSRVIEVQRSAPGIPGPSEVLTIAFELDGQRFTALNGGPTFKFNESVSFVVRCDSQDEVDSYWSKLTEGGSEGPCGWLRDRFGLLADRSFPSARTHPAPEGDAGHAEDEEDRPRGA
jgi:predicted 3-demethylubiquinone-9 3-methyltransferase (glyoxalase superfamily)